MFHLGESAAPIVQLAAGRRERAQPQRRGGPFADALRGEQAARGAQTNRSGDASGNFSDHASLRADSRPLDTFPSGETPRMVCAL